MARRRKRLPRVNLRRLELSYGARVRLQIEPLREIIEKKLFPMLDAYVSEISSRTDDESDIMASIFNNIRVSFAARFSETLLNREIRNAALQINNAGADVHRQQLRTVLGVDPVQSEPWLETEVNAFVKENASLIKTLPEESLSDIEQMVFREGRRGASPQVMRKKIIEQFGATEVRAELIARDQVSKFNSKLTQIRQKQSGIEEYIWRDSDDGRVRSRHHELNGTRQKWSEPPITVTSGKRAGERNHAGEDIGCRCYPEPVLDNLIPGL